MSDLNTLAGIREATARLDALAARLEAAFAKQVEGYICEKCGGLDGSETPCTCADSMDADSAGYEPGEHRSVF